SASTRGLFVLGRRAASEDLLSAGGLVCAGRIVRTLDPNLSNVRIEQESGDRSRRVHRALEGTIHFAARDVVRGEEGPPDGVPAGFDRNLLRRPAVAGGVRDFFIPIEQLHAFAIDGDFELLALHPAEHSLKITGDAFDLERIFAIGRELILNEDA